MRLVLYERYEAERLRLLSASGQEPAAGLARTLLREERYHALFADAWLTRLARGREEGHRKVQAALEAAWPEALGLFEETDADATLVAARIVDAPAAQRRRWDAAVRQVLEPCGLVIPSASPKEGGRRGRHTPEFDRLHDQMTEVWRSDPEARW